jgi:spore germination protein KC
LRKEKIIIVLIVILLILSCSGCSDRIELEEQAYVTALGIDKGKDNNLSITYQITNVNYGNQGKGMSSEKEV